MNNETIVIEDYINVEEKLNQLGCNIPSLLALLPRNFKEVDSKNDLIHEGTVSTIRKLFLQNDISETPIEKEKEKYPQVVEHAFEWIGPTILFTSTLILQNPYLITVSLNVISNYLTDWFKGVKQINRKAKLSIIIKTKSGRYKKIKYEGSDSGLKELPKIIREVYDETRS